MRKYILFICINLSAIFLFQPLIYTTGLSSAYANEAIVQASVDQNQITEDDSVTLKFLVNAEEMVDLGEPQYHAPDFELVNKYQGNSVQSVYDQGRFKVQNTVEVNHVLRPKRTGSLSISNIQLKVDSKNFTSPDIQIRVDASSPVTAGVGSGSPLAGSKIQSAGRPAFLRADVNKSKVFKGEELIVTYSIFTQGAFSSPEALKWPTLSGFLKEEIEMPLGGRGRFSQSDRVVLQGKEYAKTLLLRYAAFPVREGKLSLDPLELKIVYQIQDLRNFYFGGGLLKPMTLKSDPVSIEVLPLPMEGRPGAFTGGVGKFKILGRADRGKVKVNEAITYKLEVTGEGNFGSISEPKIQWPVDWEVFDLKASSQNSSSGRSAKRVFEFVLIPRASGTVNLPVVEMGFFDPSQKKYYLESTPGSLIEVLPSAAGGDESSNKRLSQNKAIDPNGEGEKWQEDSNRKAEPRFLKLPSAEPSTIRGRPIWRYVYWASILVLVGLLGLILWDQLRRKKKSAVAKKDQKAKHGDPLFWKQFELKIKKIALSRQEIVVAFRELADRLYHQLSLHLGRSVTSLKGLSYKELGDLLRSEHQWVEEDWKLLRIILEKPEWLEFGGSATSTDTLTTELKDLSKKARKLDQNLLS